MVFDTPTEKVVKAWEPEQSSENVDPNVGTVSEADAEAAPKKDSTVKVRIESVAGLIYQGSGFVTANLRRLPVGLR